MATEHWYRYDDYDDAPMLWQHPVVKHTPKGVWLDPYNTGVGKHKFVLNDSRKQWACPTVEAARESYKRRKRKQVEILEAQLARAKKCLAQKFDDELNFGYELTDISSLG